MAQHPLPLPADAARAPAPAAAPAKHMAAPVLPVAPPSPLYQVRCSCGQPLSGQRSATHQIMLCPNCEGNVFVLPLGAWHLPTAPTPAASQQSDLRWRDWALVATACATAILALLLVYNAWFARPRSDTPQPVSPLDARAQLLDRLARAQAHFADGHFRQAAAALAMSDKDAPLHLLSAEQHREWRQLAREAALGADLLAESLEEIVRHAAGARGPEWAADFPYRYQGKSVLFDAEFRRDREGKWHMSYPLFLGKERVRLAVDDLKVLDAVPQDEPRRLVIGVRLASIQLEPPGPAWVVRFVPTDGVLFTHPGVARLCPPLGDPDALEVLERQKAWVRPE